MVRSFKLKKRTSTLGASREERALSALESSLAGGTYDSRGNGPSKFYQRTLSRLGLREAYSMDEQREPVPTSITMESRRRNPRSAPLNTATSFGTITTRSSLSPRRPARFGRSQSAPRATQRATSPLKGGRRPGAKSMRSANPSLSSSIPSSVKSTPNNAMECEERIEVVQMTNEQNRPFVRILVSKTSYKPTPMENGVEVIPRRKPARSANPNAKRNDSKELQRHYLRRKDPERIEREPAPTPIDECMPPILKTMDTMELSMCAGAADVAANAVSACPDPAEGSFQGDVNALRRINSLVKSKSGLMNALVRKGEPAVVRSFPEPDQRDDIAAPNYYGIHSLRTDPKSSRRRMLQFRKDDSIDAIVRKEQEKREKELKKEEKKQKQIQKRLDNDAKKQIKKELYNQETKQNSSPSRKNSVNFSTIQKINYIDTSRSDNKIYNETWERQSSSSSSSEGFLDRVVASFSRDLEGIPANVSFVSSGEGTTGHGSYDSSILSSGGTYESITSRDTAAMQEFVERRQGKSIMGGIGNAFFGQRLREDERDVRMVDSDISISSYGEDEDDSTDSSAAMRYLNQLRQRTVPIDP